ncbi:thymidylate kinase [Plasmodium brasilianum]|uniref:Thymidylate kinase n=2 Tax=Plasmodium (Plasmodium) TaxID=418103 RepID=A0A1C3L3M9_PLAMA|nr:thymidylate kinase, putative [Plasmodium malariae]KAI4835199.1 thymidylate kinase [Plasmodium brasilianum]SBT81181.1 thymidylate kinase, putative [Plasmodium malariae]SCP03784.1 thymidylate kinase, putative [Plasmodium malariae]
MNTINTFSNSDKKKGKFIVFEGLDRSGKSTQSKLLVEHLKGKNVDVKHLYFPNRETVTGQIIANYLKMENNFPNETIHLLFSANRWERMNEIKNLLIKGVWVVCDRYAYSGVAYSCGALNLTKSWCMNPDQGLIKPDVVFYLDVSPTFAQNRSKYGEEIYEKVEVQKRIYENYKHFSNEDYWINIDATKKIDDIHNDIVQEIAKLKSFEEEYFKFLWS